MIKDNNLRIVVNWLLVFSVFIIITMWFAVGDRNNFDLYSTQKCAELNGQYIVTESKMGNVAYCYVGSDRYFYENVDGIISMKKDNGVFVR
jgi:hypothetical protein